MPVQVVTTRLRPIEIQKQSTRPTCVTPPRGWQGNRLFIQQTFKDFEPAVKRDTGAALTNSRFVTCGTEGCVFFGRHTKLGHVAMKVGFKPCHAQTGQRTDYEAATPVIGKRLPGVARVHGVWHSKRTGAYAVMRERVRTTWGHYAQERKITRTAVKEGLDAVEAFGRSFITSCQAGKSYRPPGQAMAQLRSGGMLPIVDGLRALAAKGVCVGADLLPQNIGWRRGADRRPEPVMLDMGFSWPAARYRGAVPQPTLAGTRKRRR